MSVIVKILPSIIDAIKVIENQYAETGKGKQKLELVRVILETAYSFAEDVGDTDFNDIWPMVSKVISGIVSVFNATGWNK